LIFVSLFVLKFFFVRSGFCAIWDNAGHDGPLFSTPEVESKVIGFLNKIFAKPGGQTLKTRNQ
jgi:hypothetical protein